MYLPNTSKLSTKEKIKAFEETSTYFMKCGYTAYEIMDVIELFVEKEMYEAAQGILNAIKN